MCFFIFRFSVYANWPGGRSAEALEVNSIKHIPGGTWDETPDKCLRSSLGTVGKILLMKHKKINERDKWLEKSIAEWWEIIFSFSKMKDFTNGNPKCDETGTLMVEVY